MYRSLVSLLPSALFVMTAIASASDGETVHMMSSGMASYGFGIGVPVMGHVVSSGFQHSLTPMPPGTVGQTYSRPSHPVPADEHPRTAMLAIRDNGAVPFLSVQNMGGIKMKSGVWLFESNRPLDPGACQIVRVEARHHEKEIEPYATKFVRLIPGRIVYLDF